MTTLLLLLIVYAIALSIGLARRGLTSVTKISVVPTGRPLTRILIIGATGGTGRQLLVRALSLERLGVCGECLAIELEITLVHDHRASIHERWHRRRQSGAPVFELVYRIVVEVIEEL